MNMKKTIRICLALLTVAVMLTCSVSCGMEAASAYTVLRDHVKEKVKENGTDGSSLRISTDEDQVVATYLLIRNEADDDGAMEEKTYLVAQAMTSAASIYRVELQLSSEDVTTSGWTFYDMNASGLISAMATSSLNANEWSGADLIPFDTVTGLTPEYDYSSRVSATAMTNAALLAFDRYTQQNLNLSIDDFGFRALSEAYRYTPSETEAEDDLGGAFSVERLKLAGTMLLVGMGMVFLVLAILWGVLIIFKKIMYDGAAKDKKENDSDSSVAPTAAPAPDNAMVAAVAGAMAYREDDAAVVAAITAAIAETIASDPELSREFADGFRVVSFKRKSGKNAWNK